MSRKILLGALLLLMVLAAGTLMLNGCGEKQGQNVVGPTTDTVRTTPQPLALANTFPSAWKFPFFGSRQISAGYGPNGGSSFHTGQDYYAIDWNLPGSGDCGTPVLAAADGHVVFAGWKTGYGNTVIVDCLNGYLYRVAHLDQIRVGPMSVLRGAILGYCGTTPGYPYSTGCHIHFVVYRGSYVGNGNINGSSVSQTGISGQYNLVVGGWYPSYQ